ncbi:MAG: GntR family transcriptional regulator [Aggregatilineales bacterium]
MSDSRNAPLSHIVADVLRQSLNDGVYLCGDRLVELTISQEMNVSQNTARDALSILENEGWVVKRARHGTFVKTFVVDEVHELVMLRAVLEKLALGWALDNMTPEHLETLRQFVHKARNFADLQNVHAARDMLSRFHNHIVTMTGKNQTADILARIHNHSRLLDNLRNSHAIQHVLQAGILNFYDLLITHIGENDTIAAQNALKAIIIDEGEALLSVLSAVLNNPNAE